MYKRSERANQTRLGQNSTNDDVLEEYGEESFNPAGSRRHYNNECSQLRLQARGLDIAVNPSSGIDLNTIMPPANPLGSGPAA